MALACLMVLSVVSFVACDDEAIEEQAAKIADLETATAALQTAINTKANASDLSDAVADFTAALADVAAKGDVDAVKTNLDAVKATADSALAKADANATAIETLKTAIEAIEEALEAKADKATVEAAIAEMQTAMDLLATKAELEAATATLQAAIDTKAAKDVVDAAVKELKDAIAATNGDVEAVETALAAVKATADAALAKAEALGDVDALLETIKNVTTLCTQLGVQVEGLEDAIDGLINIDDWNEATEGVREAIIELTEKYNEITRTYYDADELAKIDIAYKVAEISITRAPNVAALEGAVDEFVETVKSLPTVGDKVEEMFDAVVADLETLNTYYKAENGKSLLDEAAVTLLAEVAEDLAAALAKYTAEYDAGRIPDGELGFVYNDCKDDLDAYNARKVALDAAKAEAEDINALIAEYTETISAEGYEVNVTMTENLNTLEERIAAWDTTYFSAEFAAEKANESANYKLVKHADYKALVDNYKTLGLDAAGLLAEFAESLDFTVTLLSKADLEESLKLYNKYTDKCKADGTSLDHKYNDKTGAYYLDILLTKTAEYNALVEEAQAAYDAVYEDITATNVTIYDAAAIEAMLDWYADYELTGEFVTEVKVTGTETYVTNATYDALVKVQAACKVIVDAKVAETAKVNELLAALGTAGAVEGVPGSFTLKMCGECAGTGVVDEAVCTACNGNRIDFSANEIKLSDEENIVKVRKAYDEWLNGTNAPEGYTADQYKIDTTSTLYVADADDYANLEKAEWYLTYMLKMFRDNTVIPGIEALDVENPDQATLNTVNSNIKLMYAMNCGDESCLSDANKTAVAAYDLALYKKTELDKVQDLYDDMKADLESVGINTDTFAGKYEALCTLVAAAENKTAVDSAITVWTEGDYADAKAAYELAVAKNAAKAEVKADYDAKVAEYEAAGKDATTLDKFAALYTMTCGEIDDATTIAAVETAVTRWDNERVNFYD